jgi:hypothetical protein
MMQTSSQCLAAALLETSSGLGSDEQIDFKIRVEKFECLRGSGAKTVD